ncbi:hypothetical protein FRC11_009606, partial [Ceratobasidium sp. 423]
MASQGTSAGIYITLQRLAEQLVQNTVLYAHMLSQSKQLERIEKSIEDIQGTVNKLSNDTSSSWTATKEQK